MTSATWEHVGGGCLIGPLAQTQGRYPCDDEYTSSDGSLSASFSTTRDAHVAAPLEIPSPQALARSDGYRLASVRTNPLRTWHKVVLGLLAVGVVGAGVFLYSATARAAPAAPPSEEAAVAAAIEQLGPDAPTAQISQLAFSTAYPGQTPAEPEWASIVTQVETVLGRPLVPIKIPSGPAFEDEAAELVTDWMGSLSDAQRSAVQQAVGAALWDPLVASAAGGDDVATRGALLAIKLAIEAQAQDSKISALATYASLQSNLGDDKLQEFLEILDDTVGRPQVNPTARALLRSSA